MIEIHLYGELRRYAPQSRPDADSVLYLPSEGIRTLEDVLRKAGIDPSEVKQVFLNRALLTTTSPMGSLLGYVSARDRIPPSGLPLEAEIHPGDRLGLFPARMALLMI